MTRPISPEDLQSADVERRRAAAEYLSRHAVDAEVIVPLVRAAGDDDEQVREWSVAALEEAEPSFDALDGLVSLLNGPNDDAAYWAATLIGRLGDQAAPAAEQLGALVGGEASQAVRQRAAWALEKIGPSASCVLPALRSATESEDPRLARQARRAIDAIGVP